MSQKETSLGGLEPPTFRLTAERANRLRHRDTYNFFIHLKFCYLVIFNFIIKIKIPNERKHT